MGATRRSHLASFAQLDYRAILPTCLDATANLHSGPGILIDSICILLA